MPLLRPGEVLELVPGMVVTQHSGDGKANQYFLRGFNLDHGTDFRTSVAGIPVNMPTHAHGQGYSDLNFLIPELIDRVRYRKGPYYADEGDFSSAGAAHIDYARQLDGTLAQLGVGQNGYQRMLLAGSPAAGNGNLLYALEAFHNNGPWSVPEGYKRLNGVLRYSEGTRFDGLSVTAMAYGADWTATDQVPQRAIDAGLIARHASLDPVNGDQFRQSDRRRAGGLSASRTNYARWGAFEVENTIGVEARIDRIRPLGLYATSARATLSTLREDRVDQRSIAFHVQNQTRWMEKFRTVAGLRADFYRFDVDSSNLGANAGLVNDRLLSPKITAIFGPWETTEFYLNYGHGFHSNDARGTTLVVDPSSGAAAEKVTPLVKTRGYEIGMRSEPLPGWQTTFSLWALNIDSELLFVGDAGVTEASRPSRRRGIEWSNLYAINAWLAIDADLALSHARFRGNESPGAGNYIPGAVASTASLGLTIDQRGPCFGAFRIRHFGPRPLIEDNSQRSAATPVAGLHTHPAEPRVLRLTLTHRF